MSLFDSDGEVTAVTDPMGRTSQTQFDAAGQATATVDALNRTTQQQYDLDGEVTKIVDPIGRTNQTLFDAAGQETATIDALNRTAQQQYDLDGEVTKSTDPMGRTNQTLFDAAGQATATIDALNRTSQQQYDLDGEVTKTIDANGNTSSQQYDNDGRVTASIDANNHTTRQAYDNDDRVTASIDGDGNTTQYRYDDEGNRTAVIDPNLNTTVMLFDADNQLTAQVDPLGHTTAMTYDDDGNQTAVIAPDHSSIVSLYDADNRLTMQVWYDPSGGTVDTLRKSFDNDGRLLTASNNTGTYGFLYDADGRVTSVTEPFGISLGMQYDASGQQTLVTDSFGGTQGSVYDLDGRLLQRNYSGQGQQLRIDYTYTLDGQVDTVSRYSNLAGTSLVASTTQGYDALGQVTNIQNYDASSATIDQFASQYDAAGNVTTEIDNGVTTGMTYDDANQLLSAGSQSYTYDPNGNSNSTGTSVGPGNQLLSDGTYDYGYDLKGNEISKTEIATGAGWTYGYNNANQLVYAKQWSAPHGLLGMPDLLLDAEYKYDFFGNRIEKDVTQSGTTTVTRFAVNGWDPSKPAGVGLENFDEWAVVNAGGSLQTRNITGAGVDQPLARIDQSGASDPSGTYWLLTDRLNSVRDVIDNSAAVKDSVKYDVYGNIDTASETNASYRGLYDWTGRDRDAETGLQYNRARYYDPVTARWITQDPMGFDAGDSNLYRYVTNNPTAHTDPSGNFVLAPNNDNAALFDLQRWLTSGTGTLTNIPGFGKLPALGNHFNILPTGGNRSILMPNCSGTYLTQAIAKLDAEVKATQAKDGPGPFGAYGRRMINALMSGKDNVQVTWVGGLRGNGDAHWDSVPGNGTWWTFVPTPTSLSDPEKSTINTFYGRQVYDIAPANFDQKPFFSGLAKTYPGLPDSFWSSSMSQGFLTSEERSQLANAVAQHDVEAKTNWQQQPLNMSAVQLRIGVLREETMAEVQVTQFRGNLEADVKAVSPFLFPGPDQFKYFRPQLDAQGRVSFVPTAELRRLQIAQSLMVGVNVLGNKDEASYIPSRESTNKEGTKERRALWTPQTPEEAMAWFSMFGTTSPTKIAHDIRPSGALIESTADLGVVMPVGTLMSIGRMGVMQILRQASGAALKGALIFHTAEAIGEKFGPASAAGTYLAPIIISFLFRRFRGIPSNPFPSSPVDSPTSIPRNTLQSASLPTQPNSATRFPQGNLTPPPLGANLPNAVNPLCRNLVRTAQGALVAACFAAGTKLLTPDGFQAIEKLCVGALVLSRSETDLTGPVQAKVVEETFKRLGRVLHLHIAGKVIRTSAEHLFFVRNQGWMAAGSLRPGDQLSSHDGQWIAVEEVYDTGDYEIVYNMRVADYHTYFVSDENWGFSVWAHNSNPCALIPPNTVGNTTAEWRIGTRSQGATYTFHDEGGVSGCMTREQAWAAAGRLGLPTTGPFTVTPRTLQKIFNKHGADFGLTGNWNLSRAPDVERAIATHINSADVQRIDGLYRAADVTHVVNPQTRLNVILDGTGNVVGGWRLSVQQLESVLTTGRLF